MEPERRRNSRVAVGTDGASALLRGAVPVAVRDLSAAGIGFRVGALLEPGIYALTAFFRGLSLATPVRVTRCRDAAAEGDGRPDGKTWVAGGELLWRDEADAAALRRWLQGKGPGPS